MVHCTSPHHKDINDIYFGVLPIVVDGNVLPQVVHLMKICVMLLKALLFFIQFIAYCYIRYITDRTVMLFI